MYYFTMASRRNTGRRLVSDATLDSLQENVSALTTTVTSVVVNTGEIKGKVESFGGRIDRVDSSVRELSGRVKDLEQFDRDELRNQRDALLRRKTLVPAKGDGDVTIKLGGISVTKVIMATLAALSAGGVGVWSWITPHQHDDREPDRGNDAPREHGATDGDTE